MADPEVDLHRYVLQHHTDLVSPDEERARTLRLLAAKAARAGDSHAGAQRSAPASERARELAALAPSTLDHAIASRILNERALEVWPNTCPRCGALCRTPRARQCHACTFTWFDTPKRGWRIRRASPQWDRCADRAVCRLIPDVGLVVCVVDGAGNSAEGVRAAEAVIRRVRAETWSPRGDEWDLQELLLALDNDLARTGGETTAVIAVFGGGGRLRAAAAGDTRILARRGATDWVLPASPSPRLGSGRAAPATWSGVVDLPVYVATDGAWVGGTGALRRSLREHTGVGRSWIEEQARSSGDDATLVEIGDF